MGGFSTYGPPLLGILFVSACSGRAFESAKDNRKTDHASGGGAGTTPNIAGSAGETGRGGAAPSDPPSAAGGRPAQGGAPGSGAGGAAGNPAGGDGGSMHGTGGEGSGGSVPSIDASVADSGAEPCTSAADCPTAGTVCQKAACLGNQCGFVPDPSAAPANVRGDCRQIICSSAGTETIVADPTDLDDGNACTVDSCQGNVAHHDVAAGSRCANGARYCDPDGACVECLVDSQCTAASADECSRPTCVHGTCRIPAAGTFCNGGQDQCDGTGSCVDCVDGNGCGNCCFCLENHCVQG